MMRWGAMLYAGLAVGILAGAWDALAATDPVGSSDSTAAAGTGGTGEVAVPGEPAARRSVELPASPFPRARRDANGRFLNLAGPIDTAGPLITLPFFLRRAAAMLEGRIGFPALLFNDGAFLRENAGHSVPTVTWVGHATLLVQMDHATFLTDPIWSERASPVGFAGPKRFQPPGLALDALPPIDFVLVSHNHYDHLDVDTLRALARRDPRTRFVVPLVNAHTLRDAGVHDVVELDWGQSVEIEGLRIVCLPTQHWSARGPFDNRVSLWGSYAVIGPERRFFFSGDTGYFDGFAAIGRTYGPFDLAAVPIGAYLPAAMMRPHHMNPEEAVQAGLDLRARRLVPIHYGTFDLSDEPPDEPPRRFRAAAQGAAIAEDDTYVLRPGETREF
jgi:N-acyl-phosphatidylethanolamine-hydrolysing phospholipase D